MSKNILDPSAVVSVLPTLLPSTSKTLKSSHDGLAALLHTAMSVVAFRLVGVHETVVVSPDAENVLPVEWNSHGPENYSFKYRHDQSSLAFIMKVSKLGGRTLINTIAVESDKVATLDIATNDYVSPSFFPSDVAASDAAPLIHGFISSNRVSDLVSLFKVMVIQKLVPGLLKEGYQEEPEAAQPNPNVGTSNPARANPPPQAQPRAEGPPRHPLVDPYSHIPSSNPLEIGRRDLDPIPSHPFSPPSLFPAGNDDGMFVGPNHPIFGGGRGRGPFGDRGPWGGDGFLPPMGAPPGARFDPVGPEPFPRRGGPGFGRGGPGRRGPFGSSNPDNDEFMPPGAGDMFM